jgi:signal peptidase
MWLWKAPLLQVLSVQSGSMQPLIHKGDAVIVDPVMRSAGDRGYSVGDIISYRSAQNARLVITHRVQSIDQRSGLVTTKGDNNLSADAPIPTEQIIGRVGQHVRGLGYAIDTLRSPFGLVLVIYLPALIAVVLEVRRLTAYFKPTYVLRI